ncbi:MAG: hypothetical protein IKJ42_11500 [Bacteroidaceae bacterium]|nr:hypothetical protein [Bacteroidaceae bacterium]
MRKKKEWKFLLPFLLLAGMMLHSCTDEGIVDAPSWHQAIEQGDNAIMRAAKAMVESTQGGMSMPDMFKTLGKAQTRAAGAAPQTLAAGSFTIDWEAAQSLYEEDGTVLLVPIKMKQNMAIWRFTVINNKRKAEQTPMHSVLYVKKFNSTGYVMGRVLSYAPSRQYIKRHPKYHQRLEGYNPDHTDYSGLLLVSSLDGNLSHGFNYENGCRQFMFRPNTHAHKHEHEHESAPVTRTLALPDSCQHNHATDQKTEAIHSTVFSMRMVSSTSAVSTYSYNNETGGQLYCSFCYKPVDDCVCLIVDGDKCENCKKLLKDCVCPCPFCNSHPCKCNNTDCIFCKKYPCICESTVGGGGGGNNNSSNNGNNNNQNQGGGSHGSGNTSTSTPVKHTPSSTDKMIEKAPLTMKKQKKNTCVTTIMTLIDNQLFNGSKDISEYHQYYSERTKIKVRKVTSKGIRTKWVNTFVAHFFEVELFGVSIKDAIDKGHSVMTDIPTEEPDKTHNVLVIGYTSTGKLIYIDPALGYTMTTDESYLKKSYVIEIKGLR